jgi:TonB-dependent SusC/RagA subfamily outer membrane receptor
MQRALRRFCFSVVTSVLAAFIVALPLAAQATGVIEGRVVAATTSRPLADVQVSVMGTTLGARTDEAGRFRIPAVPAGTYRVRAQRIGYSSVAPSVTVVAGQTVTADVALREAALSLEAVVVTGTAAETRQKEVGNATATIDARALELAPVTNTQEMISGRAPGITVLSNSGQPGAGGTIRLRGTSSITQGTNPIVYVDGIRIYSENTRATPGARQNTLPINDIKAEDIERIEIVKGAAATTLYGTEASNGVIQIFTKKGTAGRPQWAAEVAGGANFQGHVGPKSDASGMFLNRCRGPELADAFGVPFVDPTCPGNGKWLRTGAAQRYSLSVRGGGESMTYFVSTNFNAEEGVIATSKSKDGGFRGNFSFTPAKNLLLALNTSYNKRIINWLPDGNLANGFLLNVARGPNNNFKAGKGECIGITAICTTNSYILEQDIANDGDHFISGFTINWNPTAALTQRVNIGWDYNGSDNKQVLPFGFLNRATGQLIQQTWNHTKLSFDYAGSVQSKLWRLADVASTLSWGGQIFDDRDRFTSVTGNDFSGPGEPTLASAARVTLGAASRPRIVSAGFFLQEMLGWRDRLFLTGGLRIDGHSAFGEDFGLQTYPKISAAYAISEETFWPTRWLPTMKLRAALGESGKAPGAFDALPTWEPVAGDDARPAVTLDQRGNPNLGPERTRELEVGFDAGAFDNRLGLEFTAFYARTYGALIGVRYPPSEGFDELQLENVGTIENRGIETQLTAGLLRNERFDWQARVSLTSLNSKAIELGEVGGQPRQVPTGEDSWVREGWPIAMIFAAKVMNPDEFADPIVATDQPIGPMYPTRLIGLGTTLTIGRNLTFDAQGEYQGGAYLSNFIGYQNANRFIWQPCYETQRKLRQAYGPDGVSGTADDGSASAIADVTARDRARCSLDRTVQNSNFWISKTDFFKLRSVSLTYNIPQRLVVGGQTATVTLAGRNLYKWTKYDGLDPESRDASDQAIPGTPRYQLGRREYYQLPPYKSVLLTLRATF